MSLDALSWHVEGHEKSVFWLQHRSLCTKLAQRRNPILDFNGAKGNLGRIAAKLFESSSYAILYI